MYFFPINFLVILWFKSKLVPIYFSVSNFIYAYIFDEAVTLFCEKHRMTNNIEFRVAVI